VKSNINSVEIHPQLSNNGASSGWCTGGVAACLWPFQSPTNKQTNPPWSSHTPSQGQLGCNRQDLSVIVTLIDENLPIIDQTKHPTKGEREKYKMEGPKSWQT